MVFHPLIICPSHTSKMTYNYQIQNILKQYIHVCTYTCLFICYMSTCMDPEIFARMVGGPSPTDRKEPWQHFSPQLILRWGPNSYFKETIFFEESSHGGSQISGGLTFSMVMRPNCIFFYRKLCNSLFSRGFQTPCPLWFRALPMCTCPCLWHFKVTKNVACSKFFKGIGVHGHLKILCRQNHIFLLRSLREVPLVTTKTTLRWHYRDHNFTMILSCLRKLRCIRVSGHNR